MSGSAIKGKLVAVYRSNTMNNQDKSDTRLPKGEQLLRPTSLKFSKKMFASNQTPATPWGNAPYEFGEKKEENPHKVEKQQK